MKVEVYWNLHKNMWSVRDKRLRRVMDHPPRLWLTNCTFTVQPAGRERVRREKRKNVHAWVNGDWQMRRVGWREMCEVKYNPHTQDSFYVQCSHGWYAIESAEAVYFDDEGRCWAYKPLPKEA